jgi:dinuclear metal center YbgI/SA1388 family protein
MRLFFAPLFSFTFSIMQLLIKDITCLLEQLAPLQLQESYDNCGLLVGSANTVATGALITLDVTENIIDEAIANQCNLIIAHHPLIFSGIKKLSGNSWIERTLVKAIKHDIAIYAIHTNLDNIRCGVNQMMADKIGLQHGKILRQKKELLRKLICFCPKDDAEGVKDALFGAGAGSIGNYSECSFSSNGIGTFRGNDLSNPQIGTRGELQQVAEIKIETIFPAYLETNILNAMFEAHPYEEVAYEVSTLLNQWQGVGAGYVGMLPQSMEEKDFLQHLKKVFHCGSIKHTALSGKKIQKVALCGGSGSFLLKDALQQQADIFVTADFKYHQFFDADNQIVIADIGHYESEQFTKELIFNEIQKKFSTFALCLSKNNTNPIHYY